MANTTHTVIPEGGGDYVSLNAWEDAIDGTVYDAGETATVNCSGLTDDTTTVIIAGWDSDVVVYINGNNTSGKFDTSKYLLLTSSSSVSVNITFNTVLSNIQVKSEGLAGALTVGGNSWTTTINNCIFFGGKGNVSSCAASNANGPPTNANHGTVKNSIFIASSNSSGSAFVLSSAGTWSFYNCIFLAHTGTGALKNGNAYATVNICKNSYAYAATSAFLNSLGTITTFTCASNDGTLSSSQVNFSVSEGTYFTNVTEETEDFHIGVNSSLINIGTDLSSIFTDDIDGDTRPTGAGTWDIGVDEYVVEGGSALGIINLKTSWWGDL